MKNGKVLFITSINADVNTLIELLLAKFNYELICYNPPQSGKQFSELEETCKKSKPNIIIIANDDFSTPLEQELCKELRKSRYFRRIGILLLFRPREHDNKIVKPDCDADEYLRMPFAHEELEQQLRVLIDMYS
ncbi:MAG: hypothetical protein IT327_18960 [Anaerolineae bacterium]|nr:hypothetical protein [Anaerolineae bacterium]